jgi:hypothetical protein
MTRPYDLPQTFHPTPDPTERKRRSGGATTATRSLTCNPWDARQDDEIPPLPRLHGYFDVLLLSQRDEAHDACDRLRELTVEFCRPNV